MAERSCNTGEVGGSIPTPAYQAVPERRPRGDKDGSNVGTPRRAYKLLPGRQGFWNLAPVLTMFDAGLGIRLPARLRSREEEQGRGR